jgi:proteasome accessory factor B
LLFDYVSSNLDVEKREIIPFALPNRSGLWYVSGVDQHIEEVRTFRLDRVQGSFNVRRNIEPFEFPVGFELTDFDTEISTRFAIIDVRKGKGQTLRTLAQSVKDLGEWDQIKIPLHTVHSLAAEILWHGNDAFVHEPADLREYIIDQLEALVGHHE